MPPVPANIRPAYLRAVCSSNCAGKSTLHVLAKFVVGGQLRHLRPPRPLIRMPLRHRRAVLVPGRIAPQFPRNRRRVPPEPECDFSNADVLCVQEGDLLALGKRQVAPDSGAKLNGGIPPFSRNHRGPISSYTPDSRAASSLDSPEQSPSRRPRDVRGVLRSDVHASVLARSAFPEPTASALSLPLQLLGVEVLRRPIEFTHLASSASSAHRRSAIVRSADRSHANRFRSSSCFSFTTQFSTRPRAFLANKTRFLVEKTSRSRNRSQRAARRASSQIRSRSRSSAFSGQEDVKQCLQESTTPCRFLPPDEPSLRSPAACRVLDGQRAVVPHHLPCRGCAARCDDDESAD